METLQKNARILTIGDVHFKTSNIPLVNIFIEKVKELLENYKENNILPDKIVVLGDVLDTHEKLNTFPFNKACQFFDLLRGYSPLYVLVGNHDMCVTPWSMVQMFSGRIKPAWQIKVGDILQGDLPTSNRTVLNTYKGNGKMYKINNIDFDTNYIVSENHLLVLVRHILLHFYNGECYLEWLDENFILHFERMAQVPRKIRESLFPGEKMYIEIPVNKYINLPENIKERLYGVKLNPNMLVGRRCLMNVSRITINYIGYTDYIGFTVDGNNKFLLANGTLCHNSSNQNFLNENHWMNVFKKWDNVVICDNVIKHDNLVFCPYVPPGKFIDALNTVNDWDSADCIFAHQEFRNCKMGAIESKDGDIYSEDLPMVISGHIHGKDRLAKNIYYTGCALPLSDNDRNTIAMITVGNSGEIDISEIDLKLPRKEIIYSDMKNLRRDIRKKINTMDTQELLNGLCRLSISGSYEEFKTFKTSRKYRELIEKGVKVKYLEKKSENNYRDIQPKNHVNFKSTLWDLVKKENDPFLENVYHKVIMQ
jgi:3',5'-cyclic AMP phosphodiesterase CpdA